MLVCPPRPQNRGDCETMRGARRSGFSSVLCSNWTLLRLLAWIVSRIHIGDRERTLAVYLHHGLLRCPSIVIRVRRRFTKTSSAEFGSLFLVKFVPHADMELAGNNGHVFRCRMIVGWNLVVRRHLQPQYIESVF